MEKNKDLKTKTRKFWKSFSNIVFGKNIFQKFLRIYVLSVILGAVLLYCGWSHSLWTVTNYDNPDITHNYTFWDALFVSCSAFSNTGLTSICIGDFYNFFGQFVIFVLIGLGGIGIISLFFVVWNFFKKDDDVKINQLILLQSERGSNKYSVSFRSIRFCVVFIIIVEIFFGLIMSLWLNFYPNYNIDPQSYSNILTYVDSSSPIAAYHNYGTALWQGMFLSVSAMNNAGFDIFNSNASLASFRNDWNIIFQLFTVIEIVLGGIGYPLIFDIYEKIRCKKHGLNYHLSLFSKVALVTYILVFIIGLGCSFGFEYGQMTNSTLLGTSNTHNEWGKNESLNKNWAIIYNTIVTRSAGFSTFNQALLTTGSQIDFSILMFIGASPSSTGGGIRTTTFAVLILSIWHLIRRHENVTAFKKTIPQKTINNAFIVFFIGLVLVLVVSLSLYYCPTYLPNNESVYQIDNMTFIKTIYEVTSAIGTVGLTMGISELVKPIGLFLLTLTMFIGQLGISSTLLSWFNKSSKSKDIAYSIEDIKIS